jgi:hypothetical protein
MSEQTFVFSGVRRPAVAGPACRSRLRAVRRLGEPVAHLPASLEVTWIIQRGLEVAVATGCLLG